MVRPDLEGLPPLGPAVAALPPAYALRTYRPGDEGAWAALMNTGQMGEWTVARTRAELTGVPFPRFDPQGLFVVTWDGGVMAGSACAWLEDAGERETGTLHMVCVLPDHRGRGLSYPPCLAVLHRFRERGFRRVRLNTHEWRLGAVKTYLRLGFQPLYRHELHPQQWAEVLRRLAWAGPVRPLRVEDLS